MCNDRARWAFRFRLLWRFTTGLHPQAQDAVTAEWNSMAAGWDSADVDATNRTTLAIIRQALQEHLALGPDAMRAMRVLDFGCGTGVLTQLLQPVLEDHAKTVLFANVSAEAAASGAALEALRFASKVNACHLGRPRKMMKA